MTQTANDLAVYMRHKANQEHDANVANVLRKVAEAIEEFEDGKFIGEDVQPVTEQN